MKRPPDSGRRFQDDLVAQGLQTADQAPFDGQAVPLVELVAAEVVIQLSVAQQVVDTDQDGVTHRHRGPLGAAPGRQPAILGGQIGPLTPCSGMRSFEQGGARPRLGGREETIGHASRT